MPERPDNERRRIELSGVQVAASALAAVSSAFLLSELGAAGTVIGAAIASVVATVGSALYVHLFRRTSEQLRDVRASVGTEARTARDDDVTRALPVFDPSTLDTGPVTQAGEPVAVAEPSCGRTWLVRSAIAAVAVFAIAMTAITVVEVGMGRSFASLFGNGGGSSTIGNITDGGHKADPDKTGNNENNENEQNEQNERNGKDGTGGGTPTPGSTPTPGATGGTSSGGATGDPSGNATGQPDPTGSATTPPTGGTTPTAPTTGASTPPPTAPSSGGAATQQQEAGGSAQDGTTTGAAR